MTSPKIFCDYNVTPARAVDTSNHPLIQALVDPIGIGKPSGLNLYCVCLSTIASFDCPWHQLKIMIFLLTASLRSQNRPWTLLSRFIFECHPTAIMFGWRLVGTVCKGKLKATSRSTDMEGGASQPSRIGLHRLSCVKCCTFPGSKQLGRHWGCGRDFADSCCTVGTCPRPSSSTKVAVVREGVNRCSHLKTFLWEIWKASSPDVSWGKGHQTVHVTLYWQALKLQVYNNFPSGREGGQQTQWTTGTHGVVVVDWHAVAV